MMMVKFFTIMVILDDTYDRYASLPEAEGLANSLKRYQNFRSTLTMIMIIMLIKNDGDGEMMMLYRWAHDHTMDKQPDYLKVTLNFMLDTFEEFERELGPDGRSDNVTAAIEVVSQLNSFL